MPVASRARPAIAGVTSRMRRSPASAPADLAAQTVTDDVAAEPRLRPDRRRSGALAPIAFAAATGNANLETGGAARLAAAGPVVAPAGAALALVAAGRARN